jgi:transposase-like protein
VASIVLRTAGIKTYSGTVGPGLDRPERPSACPFCDGERVWFDGWRLVFAVVLADGTSHRFDDGLWIQRVCCARCYTSWPLRPPFLYPHRTLEPDVAEAAALAYLGEAGATYAQVAAAHGCSPRTVWRWVGWLGRLVVGGELLAEAERLTGAGQAAALIPREVPQDHAKALSPERDVTLLAAFQTLVAFAVWARSQPAPPEDSSPLRTWLSVRFLAFREIHHFPCSSVSPLLPGDATGPPRLHGGRELR